MGDRQNLSLAGLMVGGLLSWVLPWQPAAPQVQPKFSTSAGAERSDSILTVSVKGLKVENASMADALLKLRASDISHVVIGFERIPHREDETGGPISMTFTETTLGEAIKGLCQADPRYEYEVIDGNTIDAGFSGSIIEVRPRGAVKNPDDLLNLKVKDYKVDARSAGEIEAIEHISEDAPELRAFLRQKHEEWVKKTGRQPGGFPGSIMSGNMPPPPLVLELHDRTVREILDAISLKSIERFRKGKNYGPVGWEYDFVIKPNATTGLDGIPSWKVF